MSLALSPAFPYAPSHPFSARCNSCRWNIICKSALISRMVGGGVLSAKRDTSKWRHGIPRSSISCSRLALVPRVSTVFSLLVCGSPYRVLFFSPLEASHPSRLTFLLSSRVSAVASCLIRGSLIRARGRAHRSVLLRLVKLTLNARRSPFPLRSLPPVDFSLTRCTRTPKSTRAFKPLQSRGPLEANAFDR